jgi:hypothetical protein
MMMKIKKWIKFQLVVGVKSIWAEDNLVDVLQWWKKHAFQLSKEDSETNKVKGKIRTGDWELSKRQRSPLDHEICHNSIGEKKDL